MFLKYPIATIHSFFYIWYPNQVTFSLPNYQTKEILTLVAKLNIKIL